MNLPEIPLSNEAQRLFERLKPKIKTEIDSLSNIPVAVLLWGPGVNSIDSGLGQLRSDLRSLLRQNGHLALFSEELIVDNKASVRLQQLIHAQQFDLIISLPSTPGSIGEVHDFAGDRRVNSKLLVYLNNDYLSGYSNQSLQALCSILTYEVLYYNGLDDLDFVRKSVIEHVQRVREVKYFYQGRI